MATPVVYNGVSYSIPAFGDVGYAQGPGNLSSYLIALSGGPQASGGLFSLTAPLNFGPNFGIVAVNFTSTSANPATAGTIRLANPDTIDWRNFANSGNLPLGVNASDQLTFNGVVISTAAAGGTVNTGVAGRLTLYPAAGNTVDDVYTQNAFGIDILIAAQAARSIALEYTIPNPGNAVATATFSLLELAQTFTAIKTFSAGAGAITMSASTIAMGANKITGLANGTAATDAAAFGQVPAALVPGQLPGTATNDSATAGNVGQYLVSANSGGTNAPLTAVWADATSLSLTAGDWDVSAVIYWNRAGSTWTEVDLGISLTTGNSATGLNLGDNQLVASTPAATLVDSFSLDIPNYRFSLAATTTVFMKVLTRYSVGTPAYYYRFSARRMR